MSRTNGKEQKSRVKWDEIFWVINNLNDSELEEVKDRKLPIKDCLNFVDTIIESGGEFKHSWDDYSGTPAVKLMFFDLAFENAGYAVSARGENWLHCIRIIEYKFNVLCKGNLSEAQGRESERMFG